MSDTLKTPRENRSNPRWYIVQAHSGFEKKVAQSILEDAAKQGVSELFEDIVVPTESVVEIRRGKKVASERKFFPGYVLVKMVMNDVSWQLVKNTPKIAGFLGGGGNRPQPVMQSEVDRIFAQVQEGIEKPKSQILFEIGEQVKITEGPFESFVGIIEEVDQEKERIKLSVSIFGRPTPLELQYSQAEKIS